MRRFPGMFVVAVTLGIGLFASGCQDKINFLRARNELNHGVRAFTAADYASAINRFDAAIEYDPELLAARSYRASAYMMQYIPGGESEENRQVAQKALTGFEEVLSRDPANEVALASMASLFFNMKEFDKAKEAYRTLLEHNPNNKEALYTIGVINWSITFPRDMEVRASLGMTPEDPGPIKDNEARLELAEQNTPLIEEGLKALNDALKIDPEYDNAMAYVNLLYRRQADIAETKEEYEQLNAQADDWVQKSLETKKRKADAEIQEAFQ
ncbi:MAG TPA: tetratricopeptide repeat protein [Bryobacterales bacterium]|nr:tetratricopeptide repeat protein [Bryobacterales bacterium]